MRYLLLLLAAGCTKPRPSMPNTDELHTALATLEHRVLQLMLAEDTDECQRAVQRSKMNGGIVYVDHNGHCTFVRPLPRSRR